MKKLIIATLGLFFSMNVYAKNNWTITVNNESDYYYILGPFFDNWRNCWTVDKNLASGAIFAPQTSSIVKINENYSFPFCTNAPHELNVYGFISDVSKNSYASVHKLVFTNSLLPQDIFLLTSYKKYIKILNTSLAGHRCFLSEYDDLLTCHTRAQNGDMNLIINVYNNGDANVTSDQCIKTALTKKDD